MTGQKKRFIGHTNKRDFVNWVVFECGESLSLTFKQTLMQELFTGRARLL